jgi:copper transporter 1
VIGLIGGHVSFRAQIIARKELATPSEDSEKPVKSSTPAQPSGTGIIGSRTALPFIPAHDIPRGLLHMGQTAFGFAFMLAVMYVYV